VVAIQDSTKVDRRHCTLVLQEFTQVDEILGRYLGPNHPARKELERLMGDLRQKLGPIGS
jgi:hypothetical protein